MIDVEKTGKNVYETVVKFFGTVNNAADELGISNMAIYHWKNTKAIPSIDTLVEIAEKVGCKVDDLIVR